MSSYDRPGALDDAIDAAVREMMQLDPRPGLRHRVAGSIGARPSRSYGFRFGLAAAAIAVMILASLLVLRSPNSSHPVPGPRVAEAPPAAPAMPPAGPQAAEAAFENRAALTSQSPSPPVATRAPGRNVTTSESIFGARTDRVTAASIPDLPDDSADSGLAVDVVPPLPGRMAIPPIRVVPIGVTPLAIEPLSVGALPTRR